MHLYIYIFIYLYVYVLIFYLSKHTVCLLTALFKEDVVLSILITQVILITFYLFINTWHVMIHLVLVIRDGTYKVGFQTF
jgi:hypothetical protein